MNKEWFDERDAGTGECLAQGHIQKKHTNDFWYCTSLSAENQKNAPKIVHFVKSQ